MKKNKISVDDLLKIIPNKYELSILAGKTARNELNKGTQKSKIINNVFNSIVENKVTFSYKE